jgi:hypothetical protein
MAVTFVDSRDYDEVVQEPAQSGIGGGAAVGFVWL